jgi:long-chain acyl-CoA synthetase
VRKPASVGLPVPDVEMAIFDDRGKPLPGGDVGEICVRGPNVMKGYWNLPEATAETFFGDWVRTGDLGYIDADGYVFMVDRKKDMIIVNGMNVYPRIIEEALFRHPDVVEAAVVGEPHASHGEIVVAHVVAREDSGLDAAAVKGWCRDQLGRHELPRKVILRDSLPKNATGKVLKRELRKEGELERGIDSR